MGWTRSAMSRSPKQALASVTQTVEAQMLQLCWANPTRQEKDQSQLLDASARSSRRHEAARRRAEAYHGRSDDAMEGSAALQNAMRRRLRREAATLNGQQSASLNVNVDF